MAGGLPSFRKLGNVSSENLQGRGVVSITVWLHDNLHILVERYQEAQQAFHGKLPELTAQHLRNIGLADSEQAGGGCPTHRVACECVGVSAIPLLGATVELSLGLASSLCA
jgi:hypothetical protein